VSPGNRNSQPSAAADATARDCAITFSIAVQHGGDVEGTARHSEIAKAERADPLAQHLIASLVATVPE